MNLENVFDQLSYGELAQVFVGSGEAGQITEENRKRIGASVELGLTELHKRFLLKEGKVRITTVPGLQTYILHSKYAVSNTKSKEPVKYIDDAGQPFTDDIIKIERVYDSAGNELLLNVIDDPESIRTPTFNSVVLPIGLAAQTYTAVYRANHKALDPIYTTVLPSRVEIDLPLSHLEPLLLYVASRMLNPVGMVTEFHEGNNYAAKFENACRRLEELNMRVETQGVNHRLERNGWV